MSKEWNIPASQMAANTSNPIRKIVDQMKINPNPDLDLIPLSIGDPTLFGNLNPPDSAVQGIIDAVKSGRHNGYVPSVGQEAARKSIAEYMSTENHTLTPQDIVLTCGASSALDLAISVLANPGDNLLIPRPGFSIYRTLADSLGIECRYYDLKPDQDWEIDLIQLESLIDGKTRGVVINNPSNPCGSVFRREHQINIINLLQKYKIPLIADEIYHEFVFEGVESILFANLTSDLPILSCSSLAKRFMLPGWRLGWIAVYDKHGWFKQIRAGLLALSTRILGPNTLVQAAVPDIFTHTTSDYFRNCIRIVQNNAEIAFDILSKVPGLHPIMPRGAMYMMVGVDMKRFPKFQNDLHFTEAMVSEVSVFCLPAKCFEYPNYFRIVLTVPEERMTIACERITSFCYKHAVAM